MKKKLIQLLVVFTCFFSLKAQETGRLIIRNSDANFPKFIVSLNGVGLNKVFNSTASFDYLDEKTYRVKIFQVGSPNALTFMVNSAPNYISTYFLTKDDFGVYSLLLESKVLMNTQHENPALSVPEKTTSAVSPSTLTMQMPDNTYDDMLKSVKKESLESTKLEMAKTFFGNQHLSSDQVAGILRAFSLENSKLNFAKFAYPITIDKPNYFKVYDAFSSSSSKKDMSEFIKNNP